MSSLPKRAAIAVICLAAIAAAVLYRSQESTAQATGDLKPFASWTFDAESVDGKTAKDAGKELPGTIQGKPQLITDPTPALVFAGPGDYVTIQKGVTPNAKFLPKRDFSLTAWVRIDEPTEWGAIFGCLQDNGSNEKGVLLGYDRSTFCFALATNGANKSGEGKMTYLRGKTKYEPGRWYHLAATYDGTAMKLYVNGIPDGESKAQSGDVLYADKANLVLARYQDEDEDYPMQGAIRELHWSGHALAVEAIAAHFKANEKLAAAKLEADGPKFVVEPYLQFGTRTEMTICCEADAACDCTVEYGTTFPPKEMAKSAAAGKFHEVKLEKLQPKTKYFYKVTVTGADGKARTSKHSTFSTAVDETDAYTFAVIGDTQRNPSVTAKVSRLMWERRPHFVLHMGDVVDDGAANWQWTGDLFKPCHELFSRVAVYPCIGNHEKNHADYYKYFSLPKPEYYYSFRYGNAEFFSIDTNKPVDPESEQYKWLDKALEASTAKWKVCYHHHPCYSSDENDYGDSWKGSSTRGAPKHKHLIKLYEKHSVDINMNGHIHLYERTYPIRADKVDRKTGVTYITSGGGGGGLENFEPTPAFYKNQQRVDYHYCYFTVHGGLLECKVFDVEGRLFDDFSIRKE